MNTKRYIPDISSFFDESRKLTINDIFNSPALVQEIVSFDKNDLYSASVQGSQKNNNIKRKHRRCRNFKRTYP